MTQKVAGKTQEVVFQVRIQMPKEMYVKDLRAYIEDAISSWSGQFHPNDPLFGHFYSRRKDKVVNLTIKPVKTK